MTEGLPDMFAVIDELVGDRAESWDLAGRIPSELLRELGARGLLCSQVGAAYGGRDLSSHDNGRLTAHTGSRCSSLRSVMTSQGMAAWTIQRLATPDQSAALLPQLVSGQLAAVAFSETDAGSDLSRMATGIRFAGDSIILEGRKAWVTGAHYADLLLIFAKCDGGAGVVAVPTSAPGVHVERVTDPVGCRAAGHAHVRFDSVRLPASSILGGPGLSLPLLVTTALAYGRISVAWGCVGIVRACRNAAARHARSRTQFGKPLAEHQLVARHLAELFTAEQVAARVCEHASECWDAGSPDAVIATVLAKHVSAGNAAKAAAAAVQVLASAGARDGHVVARAYRDAKLMEIIEGSNEICQLILAEHAVATAV
ncbi:acyl-CoA dehydrogenase family protein [Actinomadura madurae]|uniref:acyl-CoA dehydrogenase family protein n=1 Tax=Actinomadura madurae TaxID=1993 RepID=UPI002026B41A|nr:acyl-CoA dehydrogenase family protein [Actinomadura madurae]MCP9955740.1 acyl-CoA dehydrogenase family protein [Actinomadura madurae]MCP9972472.1 acyl-CoA dehydrogenase family protein [Actinomadura madurae]MCP9984984.1 acyl-CoA dehydrogenase family protein [Actinomadura madurae]MCQ0003457.1 acyl-CoA dehydrogenase family protein [Actinomadura madurae]MCQ0021184.1 acyl-CoA dehydrogenase family protein [Actinomadura madurae]